MTSAAGLVTFILLTLWCHGPLSPFLPAAYEPVLLAYGQHFPPLLLAVIGAIASTAVELLNYHLYRRALQCKPINRVLDTRARWLTGPFLRWPFVTVWVCVLTPLPDWAARVMAGHSSYSVRRYLAAVLLARLPRFWFLAAVGLHLRLGTGVVLSIAAGSMAITLAGLLWRRWRQAGYPSLAIPGSLRGAYRSRGDLRNFQRDDSDPCLTPNSSFGTWRSAIR